MKIKTVVKKIIKSNEKISVEKIPLANYDSSDTEDDSSEWNNDHLHDDLFGNRFQEDESGKTHRVTIGFS